MRGAPANGAVLVDEDGDHLRPTDVDARGQHDPPSIEGEFRPPSRRSSVPTMMTTNPIRTMKMSRSKYAAPAGGQGGGPPSASPPPTRFERDLEALASVSRRLLGVDLDRQLGL